VIDPRTPVLVGVGTCFDDVEAVELMVRATEAAANDAGSTRVLPAVERVTVPRGTWSYTDPGRIVAERIGARDARTHVVDLGIPQQTLINHTLTAIMSGELDVALVVGAEAKARAARAAKRSTAANAQGIRSMFRREGAEAASEIDQGGAQPDVHLTPEGEFLALPEIEAGLFAPVEQYALMESALRAADGITVDAHRREIAALWSRFNAVARANPDAAFPVNMSRRVARARSGQSTARVPVREVARQPVDRRSGGGVAAVLGRGRATTRHRSAAMDLPARRPRVVRGGVTHEAPPSRSLARDAVGR
jgi:acetyl-CoA C-acetyltransferase